MEFGPKLGTDIYMVNRGTLFDSINPDGKSGMLLAVKSIDLSVEEVIVLK